MISSPGSIIVKRQQNRFVKILEQQMFFYVLAKLIMPSFLVSGCGAGYYLNDDGDDSMGSKCQPGEYQDLEFHRQNSCQRCSGTQNSPNSNFFW